MILLVFIEILKYQNDNYRTILYGSLSTNITIFWFLDLGKLKHWKFETSNALFFINLKFFSFTRFFSRPNICFHIRLRKVSSQRNFNGQFKQPILITITFYHLLMIHYSTHDSFEQRSVSKSGRERERAPVSKW